MFTPSASRSFRLAAAALLCLAFAQAPAASQADVAPFRVFLRDGTAVVCFGEYARVGERLVFTMPVAGDESHRLQVIDLPLSAVDMQKTEEYAVSVRAARYAATSGETDYAALTSLVSTALNRVAATNSPFERLQIAEEARGIVAGWPAAHYAYRMKDVREMQGLLDELVSDLRADAGVHQFDATLVASVEPPPAPAVKAPTPTEAVEQALRVARASDVATDRMALFQSIAAALGRPIPGASRDWLERMRNGVNDGIRAEMRIDRQYRDLARKSLARAMSSASDADAAGVEGVLGDIRKRDARLGGKRPGEIASLVHAVQGHLENARRLRLERDRWQLQHGALKVYEELVRAPIDQLGRARKSLDAIRQLAGPDPDVLERVRDRLERANDAIARLSPPAAAAAFHATLRSACQLAVRSAETRRRAIDAGDLQLAWDASSAATGALMLLDQAREQLQVAMRPPELK